MKLRVTWPTALIVSALVKQSTAKDSVSRKLATGMVDLFEPLDCNNNMSPHCVPWSAYVGKSNRYNDVVTIGCGTCVMFDYEGSQLELGGGLNIVGKLLIPPTAEVTIHSKMIVVQGELVVRSVGKVGSDPKIKFVLTGDEDETFRPVDNNAGRCGGGPCSVGKKAVVVAGGKVTMRGLPDNTPTWVSLYDVLSDGTPPPTIDPSSIPQYRLPPFGCHTDGILVDMSSSRGGENVFFGSVGSSWRRTPEGNLKVDQRTSYFQGPTIDLKNVRSCLRAGRTYLLTARVKLSGGEPGYTSCSLTKNGCVEVLYDYLTPKESLRRSNKWKELPSFLEPSGEFFTIAAEFTLTEQEVSLNNLYSALRISGPSHDVDIEIAEFTLREPPQSAFPTASNVCMNLVPGNHDAEAVGYSPYPFQSNTGYVNLVVATEQGSNYAYDDSLPNRFFQVRNRDYAAHSKAKNWQGSGISWSFPSPCLVRDSVFHISFRARPHPRDDEPETIVQMHMKSRREKPSPNTYKVVVECPKSRGEWVSCQGILTVTADQTDETLGPVLENEVFFTTFSDSGYALDDVQYDLDDLSIVRQGGPSTGIVVPSSIVGKWGVGSEILITSHTQEWDGDQVRTIQSIMPYVGDRGYVTLLLNESFVRPTTERQSPLFATEVALLSRNIRFEAVGNDVMSGGHFMVMRTSAQQIIDGAEFRRFGQQGTLGRYPIHFHLSGDVEGSKVTNVLVRDSHQRGIVVHGTHKLLVHNNVAYNVFGHCFMLEDGFENDNIFTHNLGARVKNIPNANLIPDNGGETDDKAAVFWMSNPRNTWADNVAAGSESSGYWLELGNAVRGPLAQNFEGFNPKKELLTSFRYNVAHSNYDHGFRSYPHGYIPDSEAVFVGLRSYMNKGSGGFLHASQNIKIFDSSFADNRKGGIDIDRADNIVIEDTDIILVSSSYRTLIDHQGATRVCGYSSTISAIDLHTYTRYDELSGSQFINVTISGMNATPGCSSVAFHLDGDVKLGAFDYFTSFEGVEIIGNPTSTFDFCEAQASGVSDVYLIDMDGSLQPPEIEVPAGSSAVVSNSPLMFHFLQGAGDECIEFEDRCYAYCSDTCFQTVTYKIPYPTWNKYWKLEVCTTDGDSCASFSGYYEYYYSGDIIEDTDINEFRYFPVHLPPGEYDAVFRDANGSKVWPGVVEEEYKTPLCPGTLVVNLDELVPDCTELIQNGDFNKGISFWANSNGSGIRPVVGGGIDGSSAAGDMKIVSHDDAIAQFVDSRCLDVVGARYEIMAWVKLDGYECDPNSEICPEIGLKGHGNGNWRMNSIGRVIGGINSDGFQLVHGVVEVTDEMSNTNIVELSVKRNSKASRMIVDDVSMALSTTSCGNPVQNSGLETGDHRFWKRSKSGALSVVRDSHSGSYALQMVNSKAQQLLPVHCFEVGERYEVTAMFKIVKSNGDPFICTNIDGEITSANQCPEIDMYGYNRGENTHEFLNAVAIAVGSMSAGWNRLYGQFTATSKTANSDFLRMSFDRVPGAFPLIVDDVLISKLDSACPDELVVNSNMEMGYEGFFSAWGKGDLFNIRTNGIGMSNRKSPGHGIAFMGTKWLNLDCFGAGDHLEITARVRMVNRNGLAVACSPSEKKAWKPDACPALMIRIRDGYGDDVVNTTEREYLRPWNSNGYNELKTSVILPPWNGDLSRFDVVVKDTPSDRTLLLDALSVRRVA